MAVFSFIEEYDFSGKTIIPFCAHGTGGLAGSVKDITDALSDSAEVLEPIGVYRPDVDLAQPVINEWLDQLGYTEEKQTESSSRTFYWRSSVQPLSVFGIDCKTAYHALRNCGNQGGKALI